VKVLMTGGTGFIGGEIGKKLVRDGHQVFVVSRNKDKAREALCYPAEIVEGDLSRHAIANLPKVDAVIHLLGQPVAVRWTKASKKIIYDSRVVSTKNLRLSLAGQQVHMISASGAGIYPDSGDHDIDEDTQPGTGFLATMCQDWEAEAAKIGSKLTLFRIGFVMSAYGGALESLIALFRRGQGRALGDGQQWMSWIHIDDMSEAFVWALSNQKTGIFNACAPTPIRNKDISGLLAQIVGKPLRGSLPKFVVKLLFGERSSVILSSLKIRPRNLIKQGFPFRHTDLEQSLQEIYKDL
jgi:uncharacterized protein